MTALVLALDFRVVTCCHEGCGVSWGQPADFDLNRRRDHKWFYCPNGHRQHYGGKSDVEKAQEEAEKERRLRERAEQRIAEEAERAASARRDALHQERRASTFKGHCTRIRKKVAHGQCPCGCEGTFANLRRHMAKHHPNWQPDAEPMTPQEVNPQ